MEVLSTIPALLRTMLLCAAPVLYLLAAFAPHLPAQAAGARWRRVHRLAALALAAAGLSAGWLVFDGAFVLRGPLLVALGDSGAVHLSVRSDAAGAIMLLLVTFIGWVITGYSARYMAGDPAQPRYIRCLMLTLSAVVLLTIANNLLLLAFGWIGTSLALNGLLTHFDDRPPALVAAHKKFLASRVGDICLLTAIWLAGSTLGSLEIDQVIDRAAQLPAYPGALQAAAILFVLGALFKCAQLPVHGWLIQVMEAPTPVSALLHAGVVNLGGFLMIRLSGLIDGSGAAQALLVVVGSLTAALASLVMMTRISIKVSLAWSTCAQMGFMLMQCGLGAYDLALLHLVAHSLYKAHAFLGAGGAVEQSRLRQMTAPGPAIGAGRWLASALAGLVLVTLAALMWRIHPSEAPALWALGGILALALAPLLAGQSLRGGMSWLLALLAGAFAVAFAYFGLHVAFSTWLGLPPVVHGVRSGLIAWALLVFLLLFVVQGVIRTRPRGALAQRWYPLFFAGLHLDELFTRITFRVWPMRPAAADGASVSTVMRTVPAASTARATR